MGVNGQPHIAAKPLGRAIYHRRRHLKLTQEGTYFRVRQVLFLQHQAYFEHKQAERHGQGWAEVGRNVINRIETGQQVKLIRDPEFMDALCVALDCSLELRMSILQLAGLDPLITFDPLQRLVTDAVRRVMHDVIPEVIRTARVDEGNCAAVASNKQLVDELVLDSLDAIVRYRRRHRLK
jgi:hypothetical protein